MKFVWDKTKNCENVEKHGVSFEEAQLAFSDANRKVENDNDHSTPSEKRYFLYGDTGQGIVTVKFTMREGNIRIIGAGYWRKGKKKYEQG